MAEDEGLVATVALSQVGAKATERRAVLDLPPDGAYSLAEVCPDSSVAEEGVPPGGGIDSVDGVEADSFYAREASLREECSGLKVSALKRRAVSGGATEEQLDEALDADDTKQHLEDLVVALELLASHGGSSMYADAQKLQCGQCGGTFGDNAKFCHNCGAERRKASVKKLAGRLTSLQLEEDLDAPAPRPKPKKKKKSIRFNFDVSDIPPELVPFALRSEAARMQMREPVLAQDGSTYEREAIVKHIAEHGRSPITGQPLEVGRLIINQAIQAQLDRSKIPAELIPFALRSEAARREMLDPVLAQDGSTYERKAIIKYIAANGVSPMTGQPLDIGRLATNTVVRKQLAVEQLGATHPDLLPFTLRDPAAQMEMRDPVLAQDGSTYEREAIMKYIAEHGTSPITGQPLDAEHLYTNETVRKQIKVFNLPAELVPFALRTESMRLEMTDPVVAQDGATYERAAILKHIAEHGVSPLTDQPIDAEHLYTNTAVRTQITVAKLPADLVPYSLRPEATRNEIRDPVVAQDGSTYERAAITAYIQEHGKSPMTGQDMDLSHLYVNQVVRSQVAIHRLPPALLPFSLRTENARMEILDPVMAEDGLTYERKAITEYILKHGNSPVTNEPMDLKRLIYNQAVGTQIELARIPPELVPFALRSEEKRMQLVEPMLATDGSTYERVAIEAYIDQYGCSPITGQPLDKDHLITNLAVQAQLDEYTNKLPGKETPQAPPTLSSPTYRKIHPQPTGAFPYNP